MRRRLLRHLVLRAGPGSPVAVQREALSEAARREVWAPAEAMADAYTNRSDGRGCRDWRRHKHSSSPAGEARATEERPNHWRLKRGGFFSPSYSGPTPYARPLAIALGQMSRRAGAAYTNAVLASGSYVLGSEFRTLQQRHANSTDHRPLRPCQTLPLRGHASVPCQRHVVHKQIGATRSEMPVRIRRAPLRSPLASVFRRRSCMAM
jgi:hypothetical protein